MNQTKLCPPFMLYLASYNIKYFKKLLKKHVQNYCYWSIKKIDYNIDRKIKEDVIIQMNYTRDKKIEITFDRYVSLLESEMELRSFDIR